MKELLTEKIRAHCYIEDSIDTPRNVLTTLHISKGEFDFVIDEFDYWDGESQFTNEELKKMPDMVIVYMGRAVRS